MDADREREVERAVAEFARRIEPCMGKPADALAVEAAANGAGVDLSPRRFPTEWADRDLAACRAEVARWTA